MVATSIAALIVVGMMASADLKAELHSLVPQVGLMAALPAASMKWGTVGASIAMIMASWYMLSVPGAVGGQSLIRVLSWLRAAGIVIGVWVVMVAWGVVSPALSWPMMASALAAVALTPVLAAKAGAVRLVVKRRGVRSASCSTLVSPKNAMAEAEAWLWWKSRHRKIVAG